MINSVLKKSASKILPLLFVLLVFLFINKAIAEINPVAINIIASDSSMEHQVRQLLNEAGLYATDNQLKSLTIAVGKKSLIKALKEDDHRSIMAIYIDAASYYQAINEVAQSFQGDQKDNPLHTREISAVFSDPNPERQIALIKELYGPAAKISIVQSGNTD